MYNLKLTFLMNIVALCCEVIKANDLFRSTYTQALYVLMTGR